MGPSTNESPKGQYCDPKVQEGLGDALNKRFLHSSNLNYVSTGAQEDVAPIQETEPTTSRPPTERAMRTEESPNGHPVRICNNFQPFVDGRKLFGLDNIYWSGKKGFPYRSVLYDAISHFIPGNDTSDWEIEPSIMSDYYTNAYITISTTSSANGSIPFPRGRDRMWKRFRFQSVKPHRQPLTMDPGKRSPNAVSVGGRYSKGCGQPELSGSRRSGRRSSGGTILTAIEGNI
ncbi:hypothetical protein BDZ45DRAFT_743298 [Acephala macrosclerotiorum]|nr:hypothetical protein BDZ45DRAFT_743298 [Acephala macrosclerotiorum]